MDYCELLNKNELKCTPQRVLILETIDSKGHIDIESLYSIINKKYKTMSLSTVYKNINLMIDNGVLLEVKIPNLKSIYETKKEKHLHFHCKYCGSIYDIEMNKNKKDLQILLNIPGIENKSIENIDLCFSGKCEKCE